MDDDYREALQQRMWYLGLLDGADNAAGAVDVWSKVVQMAWNFTQAGKPVDPEATGGRGIGG